MAQRVKNSVGIWAFGGNSTRFMPPGYHPDGAAETPLERTQRAVAGLGKLVDGYEFHYPGEVNEETLGDIQKALGPDHDLYAVALGLFCDPRYGDGSFINPKKEIRDETVSICCKGIDLAAKAGSKFIIWPGGEGYNYPFQSDYDALWTNFIEGLAKCVQHANEKGVTVFLEHKNSEPAMKILMRDMGMSMYVVRKIAEMGVDTTNLKLNMDWQHLVMNGENPAEYVSILSRENLLGHQHGNSGWGIFDDDNMVGSLIFMQTLELAKELHRVGYGSKGERIGYDLFPYTEDQVEAVKRSVLQWEFIESLARKIDSAALAEARKQKDAVRAYSLVYEVLGLDQKFIDEVYRSRG